MTQKLRTKVLAALSVGALALAISPLSSATAASPKTTAVTVVGGKGQRFTASETKNLTDGQPVTLTGRNYNTKLGIYVTYCVVPPKGQKPTACGPFDITGVNNASFWISSNPPLYAASLVTPFGKGGTFKVVMKATQFIDGQDCTKVRCAFTTRADHTNGGNRTADVFIPVTFAK